MEDVFLKCIIVTAIFWVAKKLFYAWYHENFEDSPDRDDLDDGL